MLPEPNVSLKSISEPLELEPDDELLPLDDELELDELLLDEELDELEEELLLEDVPPVTVRIAAALIAE